jgi:hypothetical protein
MRRVLDLYDHPPEDGRVVCVDEFGPLNLLPRTGKAWRLARHPRRLRATYTRTAGVMHMLAALDLATGKLFYRIRPRKRAAEFLDLLKALRARWPGEKLYVVCDNFSPHRHARVQDWCAGNGVELVFLPTYGSWLNWIVEPVGHTVDPRDGHVDHGPEHHTAGLAHHLAGGPARNAMT